MAGLEGKVALITGAGGMRGVGRATALKLAGLGADVALTDVHREVEDLPPAEVRLGWQSIQSVSEEIGALERRSLTVYCDLSQSGQIEAMVDQVAGHFGHIDIQAVRQEARSLNVPYGIRPRSGPVAREAGTGARGRTVSEAFPTMWRRLPYHAVRC